MSGSGRWSPPPGTRSSPAPAPPTFPSSSAPDASNDASRKDSPFKLASNCAFKEDNPFNLQLEFMINKSEKNRAAASPPTLPTGGGGSSVGGGSSDPAHREIRGGIDGWRAPRSAREVGGAAGGGGSRGSPVGETTPSAPRAPAGKSTAQPKSSLCTLDSSDEDSDEWFRQNFRPTKPAKPAAAASAAAAAVVAVPRLLPSMAEAKASTGALGGPYESSSPGPRSDGGWPETKRCPPPNLQASGTHTAADGRGDGCGGSSIGGCRNKVKESVGVDKPGITGGRSHHGRGITGKFPIDRPSSSQAAASGSGGVGRGQPAYAGSASTSGRSFLAFHMDDWMSDAEDNLAPPLSSSLQNGSAAVRAGVKRGRTPPARSPEGRGSDGSGGAGGGDARGRKAARDERYPAPVPQRQRSSSLSLSPPRFAACDSDYSSDADSALEPASTLTGRTGETRGARKTTGSRQRSATTGESRARARKRGHEATLNDRIEAMRVGSDGEGPPYSGGGGGRRPGRVDELDGDRPDPMDADEDGRAAHHRRKARAGRNGTGTRYMSADESQGDDELDGDDLKPHFESPPWLGPLEAFDLGGGGSINPSINRYLREFQREGVQWLYTKFKAGQGGILGDDMGLGKTVQSIALVSAVLQKTGSTQDRDELRQRRKAGLPASATGLPWLIVAPASVVRVWMDHLKLWGHFASFQLESGRDLDDLMEALEAGQLEVVATSYDLLRICAGRLKTARFDAVLFDEYHTIKSANARVSQAACELNVKRVFGLTGTLIQNDMKELWFLLHLIDPLALGEKSRFAEHFSEPIKRARAMNATDDDLRRGEKRLKELDAIRSKNMIRRTKDEVMSDVLKGKSDTVVFCDLSVVQRDLYQSVLSLPEFQLLARAKEPCDCGRRGGPRRARCCYDIPYADTGDDGEGDGDGDGIDPRAVLFRKFHPTLEKCSKCPFCCQLVAVSKLQKIANHPCLLQENLRDPVDKRDHQRRFAEVAFTKKARGIMGGLQRSQKFLDVSKTDVCGKMASLEVLLGKFYSTRDKVLVFSWSTTMLDVLESFVGAKGYVYRRLDGITSHKDRQARIKEFNSDRHAVFVFLISIRAGGQGLNLVSASRVVLYDVNWNPATELQAQDRAYRIGQRNKVAVFRLLSKGTIEEMCYMRQIYKLQITSAAMGDQARGGRRQFNAVQGAKGQEGELFGIQNLLKFSDGSLLKALRMKHDASRASSSTVEKGPGGDEVGVGESDGIAAMPAATKRKANNNLGVGVDMADEADLVLAMQGVLERADEETKAGGGDAPEDPDLAGLLGILGLDAYTHDQLVAKDEGEKELEEEEDEPDVPEIPPLAVSHDGSENAFGVTVNSRGCMAHGGQAATSLASFTASAISTPPNYRNPIPRISGKEATTPRTSAGGSGRRNRGSNYTVPNAEILKRGGGGSERNGSGGRRDRVPHSSPGSIRPLRLERVSRTRRIEGKIPGAIDASAAASAVPTATVGLSNDNRAAGMGVERGRVGAGVVLPPGGQTSPPVQAPVKKRRNLDWGKGRGSRTDSGGGGVSDKPGARVMKLFMPEYGGSGTGSGRGGGGSK